MNRLAITRMSIDPKKDRKHLAYIMLSEKREFVDFQIFREDSLFNGIYIARVENILQNIQGAFVRISPKQICYLPFDQTQSPLYVKKQSKSKVLSVGDEILVQVIKDAVKTKEPVVSTKLTIAGKYCVLTTGNRSLGVSKKLKNEDSLRMNELLRQYVKEKADANAFGMIIRTNALQIEEADLLLDLNETIERFMTMKAKAVHQCVYTVAEPPEKPYIQKLKSLDLSNLDGIYTDEKDIYDEISRVLPYLVERQQLKFYQDEQVSLGVLYNLKGSVERLVEKKVWLRSGANIIIEQLETLTVIDINSGKNISKKEAAILEINKEAAIEIARQLRLRNISGMIIVDFINMKSKQDMEELLHILKEELKKDPVTCTFADVTKLGLVELTRKKTHRSLKEMMETVG